MNKLLMIGAAVVAMTTLSGCFEYSKGEKIGQIVKLTQSGIFCKTYEAQLIRGGFNNGTGVMAAPFDFTIEDLSLLPKIQEAMDKQQEIKVHYSEELISFCRSDSGSHFLTGVEVIAN